MKGFYVYINSTSWWEQLYLIYKLPSCTVSKTYVWYAALLSSLPSPILKLKNLQENRELPPPGPTEVQVSIQATGLCGSDLHYFNHYRNGDILVREPMTLGHESAGTICAIGSSVQNLQVGDKVAVEVGQPCGKCELCKEGRYNICKEMRFRSSAKSFPHFQGTLQDRINQEAAWCYKFVFSLSFVRLRNLTI